MGSKFSTIIFDNASLYSLYFEQFRKPCLLLEFPYVPS